jgi:hypothetical protein
VGILETQLDSVTVGWVCKMTWAVEPLLGLQTSPWLNVVVAEGLAWFSPFLVLPVQIQKTTVRKHFHCYPLRLKLILERGTRECAQGPGCERQTEAVLVETPFVKVALGGGEWCS